MKCGLQIALCVALASVTISTASHAANAPVVIAEASRTVPGGRTVQVLVAQSEIASDINPSNLDVVTGGGLLGAMLATAQNARRAKKAEAAIAPLRTALGGFDADTLALETTKTVVAATPWLTPTAISMSKDSSLLGKNAALDASAASQVAFIEYSYDVSPDFSAIRVSAKLQFANKVIAKPDTARPELRLAAKNLAFAQTLTSVFTLPSPVKDSAVNAATWSADNGKAARSALMAGFADIGMLMPRALMLTGADVTAMNAKDKKKGFAGGFTGRVQQSSPSDTLLWSGGYIHAQVLRE